MHFVVPKEKRSKPGADSHEGQKGRRDVCTCTDTYSSGPIIRNKNFGRGWVSYCSYIGFSVALATELPYVVNLRLSFL